MSAACVTRRHHPSNLLNEDQFVPRIFVHSRAHSQFLAAPLLPLLLEAAAAAAVATTVATAAELKTKYTTRVVLYELV